MKSSPPVNINEENIVMVVFEFGSKECHFSYVLPAVQRKTYKSINKCLSDFAESGFRDPRLYSH